jgi:excisionase family DNA binding protein
MSSTEILCNDPANRGPVGVMATTAELTQPDFITVEQAAAVIGIGRTCAYQLARRAADFGEGTFPAVRFGKQLRVPRRKLEDLTGGPIDQSDWLFCSFPHEELPGRVNGYRFRKLAINDVKEWSFHPALTCCRWLHRHPAPIRLARRRRCFRPGVEVTVVVSIRFSESEGWVMVRG